ncbi:hypothetical protein AB0395_32985 [Streptosporangium sp. NPDC051023]|uniref:hypothetical protein n=1 Tax=Streptosporangium sp. NPDC051023 TaxID=3155410 RepID=UPI00344C4C99
MLTQRCLRAPKAGASGADFTGRARLLASAACLAVAALSAAGCAGGSAERAVAPLSAAETARLAQTELVLTGRCMEAHGFRFDTGTPPAAAGEADSRHFVFGVDDIAWAKAHGFAQPDVQEGDLKQEKNPNARYFESLSTARQSEFMKALYGDAKSRRVAVRLPSGHTISASAEGCQADAQEKLYGDFRTWFNNQTITGNLKAEVMPKVLADPRFKARQQQWARCMADAGHPTESIQAFRAAFVAEKARLTEAAATRLERKLAVTEARCVNSTQLSTVGREVQETYTREVFEKHSGTVNRYRAMQRSALSRAQALANG